MKYYNVDDQLHFMEACSKGDRLEVEKLLRTGEIDVTYQHGINKWTALHWAAKRGHEQICSILLRAGFDPTFEDCQGKTAFDVCSPDKMGLRELLEINKSAQTEELHEDETNRELSENKFTPGYIKYPNFPYSKQNSLETNSNPNSPTTRGYYSYGRRDSATKTRFLLVRTSCDAGKEAFKRITLPGGSTVEDLRKTIENAMKMGLVKTMMTLPDKIIVEENSQIEAFDSCQKIDVIFGESITNSKPRKSIPNEINQNPSRSESTPSSNLQSEAVTEEGSPQTGDAATPPTTPHEETPQSETSEVSIPIQEQESEAEEENTKEVSPPLQEAVEVTTDLHFKKDQYIPTEVTENVNLPNFEQGNEQFSEKTKNWTTAQQVVAVAAAASLVGLGCYIYKMRK